ncbi:MAG: winged helix-turn-helix domain-containing protein [Candidatus ainarchaeum sp.]|nr:winged helix-turn-helix domain-containing protein [Candidatus ainarchaeum sp.]
METKFVLDDKSFKALSAESRVNILKKLKERRMTLSELSKKLILKNSTVKEHCGLLIEAELVKKIDEGRKWKYYELTNKGKKIISPNPLEEIKVLITLSFGAIIFSIILLILLQNNIFETNNEMGTDQYLIQGEQNSIIKTDLDDTISSTTTLRGVNYNLYATSIIFALIIGIFVGWFVKKSIATNKRIADSS